MQQRHIPLIAAPVALQPGGYVGKAYAGRDTPATASAILVVEQLQPFVLTLRWACPQPVADASADPRLFVDACALLAPGTPDAPWITMGAPGAPVTGVLWRADRPQPYAIEAQGLGSVQRSEPPAGWATQASYADGHWRVTFTLPQWPALAAQQQLACAIWQGARGDRAGLKATSAGWLPL